MLFESVILPALFWTPPPLFFFPLSLFLILPLQIDTILACGGLAKNPPIHSRTCRYHWSLSLSAFVFFWGWESTCDVYMIFPPSPFLFASLYGMIRLLSNDWGIATWQPRESLLRGWLARNVGRMILSWSNIRLIGLYGLFQCLDSVNGKQSSSCRE